MDRELKSAVLVTGGAGYIGSHTAKALHEQGYLPVVYDDLSSGFREAVQWSPLVQGDLRDASAIGKAIATHGIKAVIHLAGLIEVGRSTAKPDLFWDVNVAGTVTFSPPCASMRSLAWFSRQAQPSMGRAVAARTN